MQNTYQRLFFTFVIYLSVCVCTLVFITPYSFTSFVGPAAGITTALVILWGASILPSIVIATVLFCLYLYFKLNLPIEASMVIIVLLTLMLQGFLAKQLTFIETNRQNWLRSRRYLLRFIFKIGPLISLVSAFSIIILTMLENQEIGNDLFFTFVSCWSLSVLFAVFFTPLLLLSQEPQQLSLAKRLFVIIASLLAVITIGILFTISQKVQEHQRQDTFYQVHDRVLQAIEQELNIMANKLNNLSAFIKAVDGLKREEFNLFTRQILQKKSSIRVLEWAPNINHENRAEFEKSYGNINEKSSQGGVVIASARSRYAPITHIYPTLNNEQVIGLDVYTNNKNTIDMDSVIARQGIVASAPISLIQDEQANLGVLFISALFSDLTQVNESQVNTATQEKQDDLLGFVVAVVQFEHFFQQVSPLMSDDIALFIEDVTSADPYILFGKALNNRYRHVETTEIDVNSRKWRISLGENHPWQMQEKNWQVWGMLLGATFGGMLFQVLILMMAVYSRELSAQVVNKTRELILAKEHSDYKSTAKTNFLYTLTNELQIPLQAIAHFTKQLDNTDKKERIKTIQNIELAHKNIQKILSMVVDLSKIELGELAVINEPIDFYGFLTRIDSMLKASLSKQNNTIIFLLDPSVPHFINSDELRIQQLLMAFCGGVHKLYNVNNMRLSIKVHTHNIQSGTLLFVFTSNDTGLAGNKTSFNTFVSKDIALYSAEMAMAKEVCQLMGGDATLAVSTSGERVLTVTIKVELTSNEQQQICKSTNI